MGKSRAKLEDLRSSMNMIRSRLCEALGIADTDQWDLIIAEARSIRHTQVVRTYASPASDVRREYVRLVSLGTNVCCEGVDFTMVDGKPHFIDITLHDGATIQMWQWSLLPSSIAFPSYKRWTVRNNDLVLME